LLIVNFKGVEVTRSSITTLIS